MIGVRQCTWSVFVYLFISFFVNVYVYTFLKKTSSISMQYAANNANLNPVPGRSTHHPSLSSPYVDHAGLGYVVAYPQQEYIGGEFSPGKNNISIAFRLV